MVDFESTVLVVDDERFFREAIRDTLEAAGIPCSAVASAEEALGAVRDRRVGAVVLDVALDGAAGLELLRRLGGERPELRVIVLSAQADQERVLEALRLGAADYLAKPLHDEELLLAVRRARAGFGVESSWKRLRQRLLALDARLAALAAIGPEPPGEALGEPPGQRLGEAVTETLAEVFGASKTSLMVLDETGSSLEVVAARGCDVPATRMDAVAVGGGVAGVALTHDEPLLVEDVTADARFADRRPRPRYTSRALAAAPIVWGGRRLGVLCATDREGGDAFDQNDRALLRIMALQVGALLGAGPAHPGPGDAARPTVAADAGRSDETAWLRAGGDAELARVLCDALTAEVEPERIVPAVVRLIAEHVPAAPVSLYLIDNRSGALALEGQWEGDGPDDRASLPRDRGLTGTVLQTGRLVATDHSEKDPRYDPEVDTPESGEPGPLLCVPLRLREKVLGVLRVFPTGGGGASPRTGEVLGAVVSAAVRNVLLYRSLIEAIDEVAHARREARTPRPVPGSGSGVSE